MIPVGHMVNLTWGYQDPSDLYKVTDIFYDQSSRSLLYEISQMEDSDTLYLVVQESDIEINYKETFIKLHLYE